VTWSLSAHGTGRLYALPCVHIGAVIGGRRAASSAWPGATAHFFYHRSSPRACAALRTSARRPRAARTERDMSGGFLIFGCLCLVIALTVGAPAGLRPQPLDGILGAVMILLFASVLSRSRQRLTVEVGSVF